MEEYRLLRQTVFFGLEAELLQEKPAELIRVVRVIDATVDAASANFPALLLSMLWRRFATNGAVASILVGTISALVLIYLSPAIQIDILKNSSALFPLKNPGLVTIPLSFIVGIVVSLLAPERLAQQKFAEVEQQIISLPQRD